MLLDQELQSLRNLGNLPEEAADEIARLRGKVERLLANNEMLKDAVRSARADEAHCWASRVDGLSARLREVETRYMALLKAVADGVAMQPKTLVLDLGPNEAEIDRLRTLIQRVAKYPASVDCAGTLLRDDVLREAGPPETWRA